MNQELKIEIPEYLVEIIRTSDALKAASIIGFHHITKAHKEKLDIPDDWVMLIEKEPIEDGPISGFDYVQNLKKKFPGTGGNWSDRSMEAAYFDGGKNHSKRTQPVIDASQKVFDLCSKFFDSGDQMKAMMSLLDELQALKTLEENEV